MDISEGLWFRHYSGQDERLAGVLIELGKAGVTPQPLRGGEHPKGPGLLFVDASTNWPALHNELAELPTGTQLLAMGLDPLPSVRTWELLKNGVTEVFNWFETEKPVQIVLSRLAYWQRLDEEVEQLQKRLIGRSACWLNTLRQLVDMAHSNCPVLVLGESGTGKELVAQAMHQLDPRPTKRDCVVVDCTTLVPGLSGSELFGHEKGAFTNAISTRDGALALAHQGTLFLDELGELPLPLQAELLRALQEGTYKRVGSNTWRHAQFRLVSATNRNLAEEVRRGTFRQDLYYRISGWTCHLPPLRERKEDIPALAEFFFRKHHHLTQPIDRQVYDFLLLHDYPGNVRELQQLVSRIANKHLGEGPVTIGDIPRSDWPDFAQLDAFAPGSSLETGVTTLLCQGMGLKEIKDQVTELVKKVAISREKGNLKLAADRLGCCEKTLQNHRTAVNEDSITE